jgi:hypothetical protein
VDPGRRAFVGFERSAVFVGGEVGGALARQQLSEERELKKTGIGAGVDFMKPFRPKFTDKNIHLVKFAFVDMTLHAWL